MSRYAARWILSLAYLLHRPQETVHIGSLRARPSILRAVIAYLAPSLCRKLPAVMCRAPYRHTFCNASTYIIRH